MPTATTTPDASAEKSRKLAEYDAWYDEQIRLGIADADAGKVVSSEDAEAHMEAYIARKTRKHGRQAA